MFDHPITPFEDLVVRCAASYGDSVFEVVRGMLRTPGADQVVYRCLEWIEAKYREGVIR